MATTKKRKPRGVETAQYEAGATDCCNFPLSGGACGKPAVTAVIVTDPQGLGVLLKLCRRHLCRLSVLLVEELE